MVLVDTPCDVAAAVTPGERNRVLFRELVRNEQNPCHIWAEGKELSFCKQEEEERREKKGRRKQGMSTGLH